MARNKPALVLLFLFLFSFTSLFVAVKPSQAALRDFLQKIRDAREQLGYGDQAEKMDEYYENLGDINQENLGTNSLLVTQKGLYALVSGGPGENTNLSTEKTQELSKLFGQGGAIGGMGRAVAYLYNPPASSHTYVADLLRDANVVPQAYAQGLGFASLDPILETWKVFRNIAYLFFVLIFLVIGFMIMFRHKISGQTVVTAQQAIPQIIIALVFVTFSYAIAGLMIDLMYLSMYLLIGLFGGDTGLINKNFLSLGVDLLVGDNSALSSVNNSIESFVREITRDFGVASNIVSFISGITVALIVAFAILIGVFRMFFELLKTYVAVIISIAFAPIVLMMGALPGKNTFTTWLRGLVGNLIAWPAVLLLLIMYKMITENEIGSGGFMPPYMIGQGSGAAITTLVGIGIILAIPESIKKIKEAFGAKDGVFGELMQTAITNAKRGIRPTKEIATRFATVPAGYIAGRSEAERRGVSKTAGGLIGAGLGAIGYRRTLGTGLRLMNQYGELAENAPNLATNIEESVVGMSKGRLSQRVNDVRRWRSRGKDPLDNLNWSKKKGVYHGNEVQESPDEVDDNSKIVGGKTASKIGKADR